MRGNIAPSVRLRAANVQHGWMRGRARAVSIQQLPFEVVQGGILLRKMPLCIELSVKS
jgi:hypothetical protein